MSWGGRGVSLLVLALIVSQVAATGPVAASRPTGPSASAVASVALAKAQPARILVRVSGDTLGQRPEVRIRGTAGKAKGFTKRVRTTGRFTVKRAKPGTYTVTASTVAAAGRSSVPTVSPGVVKVTKKRGASVSVLYTPAPGEVPARDTTPPAGVTGLVAAMRTVSSIGLQWVNPRDLDLAQVIVRRSEGSVPPATSADGDAIALHAPVAEWATDTDLPAARHFTYAVFTKDGAGNEGPVATLTTSTLEPPDVSGPGAVTDLQFGPRTADSLALLWTNPDDPDLTAVIVRRATGPTAPDAPDGGTQVPLGSAIDTGVTDTGLAADTQYSYAVFTRDRTGNLGPAVAITGTTAPGPDVTAPGLVSNLVVGLRTDGTVDLTWSNPGDQDFAGVIVRRAQGSVPPTSASGGTGVALDSPTAERVRDRGLAASTTYAYAVFTEDTLHNTSAPVTIRAVTAAPDSTPPGPVTDLRVSVVTDRSMTLIWNNPADADLDAVIVRRVRGAVAATRSDLGTNVALDAAMATQAEDGGLLPEGLYTYSVFTRDISGNVSVVPMTLAHRTHPQVSAGKLFGCAVRFGGRVTCWGANQVGQLGIGHRSDRPFPVPVLGVTTAAAVSSGGQHACAVEADGSVWCWGGNARGQLGAGTTDASTSPVRVSGISNAVSVSAGENHTCALLVGGTVKCWGANDRGQLGDGSTSDSLVPAPVSEIADATVLASGADHSCAVVTAGVLQCWGDNTYGQLGDATTTSRSAPVTVHAISEVRDVAMSADHTCAVTGPGALYCWGNNATEQLGDQTTTSHTEPALVPGITTAVQPAAGSGYSCVRQQDGTVACWGGGLVGGFTGMPHTVVPLDDTVSIDGGFDAICVTSATEGVLCWGDARSGQTGTLDWEYVPFPKETFQMAVPVSLAGGASHTCLALADGAVYCWGDNISGQLGDATTTQHLKPTAVSGIDDAVAVAASDSHSCAVLVGGQVRCWGDNAFGQLGDGTTTRRLTPVTVTGIDDAVAVTTGDFHTCATLADGGVTCWGFNAHGELGDGTTTQRTIPVAVTGLDAPVIDVQAGHLHTCAVLSTGVVDCWGLNADGQLGDGTTSSRLTPVGVSGITDGVAVAAGESHSCAVRAGGAVRCWGLNTSGQLGAGDTTDRLTPVAVSGISDAIGISVGFEHSCAVTASGGLRCWGLNSYGQVGDGSTTNRQIPVSPPFQGVAFDVETGAYHSCAVLDDMRVDCWGNNFHGEIGDGTQTNRLTPIGVYN